MIGTIAASILDGYGCETDAFGVVWRMGWAKAGRRWPAEVGLRSDVAELRLASGQGLALALATARLRPIFLYVAPKSALTQNYLNPTSASTSSQLYGKNTFLILLYSIRLALHHRLLDSLVGPWALRTCFFVIAQGLLSSLLCATKTAVGDEKFPPLAKWRQIPRGFPQCLPLL